MYKESGIIENKEAYKEPHLLNYKAGSVRVNVTLSRVRETIVGVEKQ
jgi:hypothetical protein